MRWGSTVYGACRHCRCRQFTPAQPDDFPVPPARPATPAAELAGPVLARHDSHMCQRCGSRYGQAYDDHECGPLTPVTVLIVQREPGR